MKIEMGRSRAERFKKGVGWGWEKKGCRRVNTNKGYMKNYMETSDIATQVQNVIRAHSGTHRI